MREKRPDLLMAHLSRSVSVHVSISVSMVGAQAFRKKEKRVLRDSHPLSQLISKSTISNVNLARNIEVSFIIPNCMRR